VDLVFTHLKEAYADKAPFSALIQAFYGRQQLPGESIRRYALALSTVLRRASDKDDKDNVQLPHPDRALRDRFVAGLGDAGLRRDLLKLIRGKGDIKFKDVREEALHLSGEYDREAMSEPAMRVAMQSADMHGQAAPRQDLSAQVAKLTAEVAALKGQLSQQSPPSRVPSQPRGLPGDRYAPDGRPYCRQCGKLGHIARRCFSQPMPGPATDNTYTNPLPYPGQGN